MIVQAPPRQSCVVLTPNAVTNTVLLEVMKIALGFVSVEVKLREVVPLGLQVADGQNDGWLKDPPK